MTKQLERTPWFDMDVRPCDDRPGKYERDWGNGAIYLDFWDGQVWRFSESGGRCNSQKMPWRGIAEDAA